MCRQTGMDCVYLRTPIRSTAEDNNQVQELNDRLKSLEDILAALASKQAATESSSTSSQVPQKQSQNQIATKTWASPAPSHKLVTNHPTQSYLATSVTGESPSLVSAADPVDGMGAVLLENEDIFNFFGPSSNITFTRHITQTVARLGHIANPWMSSFDNAGLGVPFLNTSHSPIHLHDWGKTQSREPVDPYALPSESYMDQLVDHFYEDLGLLFPIFHKPSMIETVAQMKVEGPQAMRKTWLGLLNMMLAFGTMTIARDDWGAESRAQEAHTYYERAITLCDSNILNGTSLELVQYLLLLMQYHQATQTSVQTTNTLGLAVSTAIRIGLHSRHVSESFPPLEREMRNRTWFLCIVLDRVLSMTLGHPALIPYSYVKIDLPKSIDLYQQFPTSFDQNAEYGRGVFTATIKLYQIMWKVVEKLYGQNLGFDSPPTVVDIISPLSSIDHELREWERDVPFALKTITSSELLGLVASYDPMGPLAKANRFQIVLTLRYLNLTTLLHRPVLVKFFDLASSPTNDTTEISLLSRLAFHAALVIAGIMLACQDSVVAISDPPSRMACKEGLEKAVTALAFLDRGNKIVGRCHDYLQRLIAAIEALTFKSNDFSIPDFRQMSPGEDTSSRFLSGVNLNSQIAMPRDGFLGRNVGDLMNGDDLGFLNFYFAPSTDATSNLSGLV